ncbi:hypothetical protein SAMN04490248_101119 [Salinihabitans flavidus]|uniref:Copper(I)-binding protein n=1 Tax=Salinihabitans flavidus TaxID=569882 RepID=A0A1H8LF64_9RHOB|nr:copper chaperone PCu(A)C [Salinihabitans flavidus]SEO03801.1 hypothetical protein SAMN04490248_101119 [Salinihabitans flavidus]
MSFKPLAVALAAALFAAPALAGSEIAIHEPYARTSGMMAKTGAAFMKIENGGDEDDRLIEARADMSERVELHTHIDDGDGVMKMRHVPDGFAIPAGQSHMLMRGGDHVMFLGLTRRLKDGDVVPVTLIFEKAGEITVDVPVDLDRKPREGAHGGHGMTDGD